MVRKNASAPQKPEQSNNPPKNQPIKKEPNNPPKKEQKTLEAKEQVVIPEKQQTDILDKFEVYNEKIREENNKLVQLYVNKPLVEYPDVMNAPRYLSRFVDISKLEFLDEKVTARMETQNNSMPRFPLPNEMKYPVMRCNHTQYSMYALRVTASARMVAMRNNLYKPDYHIKPNADGKWTNVLLIVRIDNGRWVVHEEESVPFYGAMKEMLTMRHEQSVHGRRLTCFEGCDHCPFTTRMSEPGIDTFSNMLLDIDVDFRIQ